jgi:hypothetical protein
VQWSATRNFATREEAERVAVLEVPPPSRQGRVSPEIARFVLELSEGGMSPRLIAAVFAEGHVKTARGGQWRETTVRRILDRERADAQRIGDDELGGFGEILA